MSDLTSNPRSPRKPKIYTVKTIDTRKHAFNVGIAKDFCPFMALWIDHLGHWAEKNLAANKHIHDGLVWCYDTLETLCDIFPYFSRRQIETLINNSIKEGLVTKGNYNHTSYDRTGWYALTPKAYFYFQHLLTDKYLKRLYSTISQICEMDFTEWGNGFPRSVTTIPDTYPDTDPYVCGEAELPSQHTVISFPSKSELQANKSHEDNEAKEFFKTKFSGLNITYDEIFAICKEHYDSKGQWVTVKKWKAWLEREKLENYSRSGSSLKKPPPNETDEERNERQYFTNQIKKEHEEKGFISKDLEKYPEMREKYAQYAK